MGSIPLQKLSFHSIGEAREFKSSYGDVDGFGIHGLSDWPYLFIHDNYPGKIEYDTTLIRKLILDIEVEIGKGFPDPTIASQPVTLVGIRVNSQRTIFGTGDYATVDDRIKYIRCSDERSLLTAFLEWWEDGDNTPDVVTGWNIEGFDIPYLVNRISFLLGPEHAKRLSPWGWLRENEFEVFGKPVKAYIPAGITILDYLQLYKKFTYTGQESYSLDHIAYVETNKRKLDYSEYSSLQDLYEQNFTKYVDYNIGDLDRVYEIDDKRRLIDLACMIAYYAKVNIVDALTSVKLWDVMAFNHLMAKNIVCPPMPKDINDHEIVGGHVKEPNPGLYNWIVSFDLTSLYPMLIQQYNISPEMYVDKVAPIIDQVLGKASLGEPQDDFSSSPLLATAANGCRFDNTRVGFMAELMANLFEERRKAKKEKLLREQELENDPNNEALKKEIARLDNIQLSLKITLNSCYGAVANKYFRYFNADFAEAITLSGQMSVRWIEQKFNAYMNKIVGTSGVDYVIAIDTDSNYLNFAPVVKKLGLTDRAKTVEILDKIAKEKFQPLIDKSFKQLADLLNAKNFMDMKREAIADRGVWLGKKRYILNVWNSEGVSYKEAKVKVVGAEAVRSSTPKICRDAIKESYKIILNGNLSELLSFINNFRATFYKSPFEDVAFPRGVSDVSSFMDRMTLYKKGTPQNSKAAIVYNDFIKRKKLDNKFEPIYDGSKIKFCYMKEPNPARANVFAVPKFLPAEFGLEEYIDRDTQFEKTYLSVIRTITDIIDWKIEAKAALPDDLF